MAIPHMFKVLESKTADGLWCGAASWFADEHQSSQASRSGPTIEFQHAALSITDPRQRWVGSRKPALNPAFAIAEVVWIMAGRDDAAFLNFFNRQLPLYAGDTKSYHGAYGHRLRRRFGFDQLERAYNVLSKNKESRQVVLQIWDPSVDLPQDTGVPSAKDIPCNVVAMLRVREERLEWTQIMRSNDLILGLPHNLVQFTTLQEVLAGWLGVEIGEYHHLSDSLHVYSSDSRHLIDLCPAPPPPNNDNLCLPKHASEQCFAELLEITDQIVDPSTKSEVLLKILESSKLPESFRNLLSILVAEGIRRRRTLDLIAPAVSFCSNSCLTTMFDRWQRRIATAV
jgi:thymidylate synthase